MARNPMNLPKLSNFSNEPKMSLPSDKRERKPRFKKLQGLLKLPKV
jgi:hypothetical protein